MIGPEGFFSNGKRTAVEGLGCGVFPLGAEKLCKIVQIVSDIWMIGPEGFFSNGKRTAV